VCQRKPSKTSEADCKVAAISILHVFIDRKFAFKTIIIVVNLRTCNGKYGITGPAAHRIFYDMIFILNNMRY
jgi:hypothetical protein